MVNATMETSGHCFLISRVASIPDISGKPMSISMTFGFSRIAASIASDAVPASPMISTSRSFSRSILNPERTTVWPSFTSGFASIVIRDQRFNLCPIARTRLNGYIAAQQRGAFLHACQPESGAAGAFLLRLVQIKAAPVIPDMYAYISFFKTQTDIYMTCLCVFDNVIQRFLNDPENRNFHRVVQVRFLAGNIHPDAYGGMLLNPACIPA